MEENNKTMKFTPQLDRSQQILDVISTVYDALTEKGYDPTSQLVGYLISGDPTYITSHNNARGVISRVERDEIIELLVKDCLAKLDKEAD